MAKMVRPEDFKGRMLISVRPGRASRARSRSSSTWASTGHLHNVGRNQREWVEAFGREVLPGLTG